MQVNSGVAPSVLGRARRTLLTLGTVVVATVAVSNVAYAQCVATGGAARVLPFLPGNTATVNSIVSVLNTINTAFLTQSSAFVSAPGNPQPNQQGGGVWVRGIGGRVDVESTGTFTNITEGGVAVGGSATCETETRQNFGGFQLGADIARLNFGGGGANLHFGVTAGYAESDARDVSPGGTFRGNFQVPFAGLYAAFTSGNFFADAQIRGDFFQNSINDPVTSSIFNKNFDARGTSLTLNAGYRFDIGNGWFVEPSVGGIFSKLDVDDINTAGTIFDGLSPNFGVPGTIRIGDIESYLGRASLRIGTNFVANNLALQPFFTASVFHEFADDVNTRIFEDPAIAGFFGFAPIASTLRTDRIGTYGQFALGIAGQIVNTGWLGYIRADYRVGENIEGLSFNGGLRYQFTPDAIVAATPMFTKGPALKAPPLMTASLYNWTGFYIGAHGGATWGNTDWSFPASGGTSTDPRFAGAIGGGQIGYNYQVGAWVIGLEVDGSWSNAKGARSCPTGPNGYALNADQFLFTCENELDWLVTGTGRIGYAWDRLLVYAKGGIAAGETTGNIRFNLANQPLAFIVPPAFRFRDNSETSIGYTVGGGFEFGIAQNWSAKAEYMFYDLGSERYDIGVPVDIDRVGNLARVGVNYRFGGHAVPVVARY